MAVRGSHWGLGKARVPAVVVLVAAAFVAVLFLATRSSNEGGSASLAGSGTNVTTADSQVPVDISALRAQYVAIGGSVDGAVTSFQQVVDGVNDRPSAAPLRAAAPALVAALRDGDARLSAVDWPQSIRYDINTYLAASSSVEGLLQNIPDDPVQTGFWLRQWAGGRDALSATSRIIKRDVGLTSSSVPG